MKRRIINWSTIAVAVSVLAIAVLYTRHLIAEQVNNHRPPQVMQPQRPEVEVLTVTGGRYTAKIRGYGQTQTHYTLSLTAQTNGQVVELSPQLEAGCRVSKGDVLLVLEDSEHLAALATARSELASAKLDLLEAQREASQAESEWKASGLTGQPSSELVLHGPQLAVAKAAVVKAEAALKSAEKDVRKTTITAPFDGIVIERLTAPGSYLQTGTAVATLYSTDMIEVPVPLAVRDWKNLPAPESLAGSGWPVQLTGVEDKKTWTGRVLRAEQHVDTTSRQRTLLVVVDSPLDQTPPLLPGIFVEVGIDGREADNVWELPSSALSQQGEIWYVTKNDTLAKLQVQSAFTHGNSIYVEVPEQMAQAPARIVAHPLSSYLPGMAVQPIVENDNV